MAAAAENGLPGGDPEKPSMYRQPGQNPFYFFYFFCKQCVDIIVLGLLAASRWAAGSAAGIEPQSVDSSLGRR